MKNENIVSILKNKIKNYDLKTNLSEHGKVISINDGIANVTGLSNVQSGELLEFPYKIFGIVLNLEEDIIGAIILGKYNLIKEGDIVKRTRNISKVGVGDVLLGRVVNATGDAIDGKGIIKYKNSRFIEIIAPGIMTRQSISEPLETGIISIDSIIPIGKGQRELIIGDRKTGKTSIAIDTIINQKGKNVKCVYVSIGQKNSSLVNTIEIIRKNGALEYTTIVSANSSDPDAMQYISPFVGMSIAEEWMSKGDDVLIVFDDLTKHAVAYRTISLLLRRPPGREAYPGDVFYLHSRLLERSGRLNKKHGGGSITAFPIIETQAGDITAYIPTNVISITDGQLFLMSDAFNAGQRPAVDFGISVSRVGSSAQIPLMKKTSSSLKLNLANYEEIKSFSEFASDTDPETTKLLNRGEKIMELLKQNVNSPMSQSIQSIILYGISNNLYDNLTIDGIKNFKSLLFSKDNKDLKALIKELDKAKDLTKINEPKILKVIENFTKLSKKY